MRELNNRDSFKVLVSAVVEYLCHCRRTIFFGYPQQLWGRGHSHSSSQLHTASQSLSWRWNSSSFISKYLHPPLPLNFLFIFHWGDSSKPNYLSFHMKVASLRVWRWSNDLAHSLLFFKEIFWVMSIRLPRASSSSLAAGIDSYSSYSLTYHLISLPLRFVPANVRDLWQTSPSPSPLPRLSLYCCLPLPLFKIGGTYLSVQVGPPISDYVCILRTQARQLAISVPSFLKFN